MSRSPPRSATRSTTLKPSLRGAGSWLVGGTATRRARPAPRRLLLAAVEDPGARRWIENDRAYTAALSVERERSEPLPRPPWRDVVSFFSKAGSVPRQAPALLDLARALGLAGAQEQRRHVLEERGADRRGADRRSAHLPDFGRRSRWWFGRRPSGGGLRPGCGGRPRGAGAPQPMERNSRRATRAFRSPRPRAGSRTTGSASPVMLTDSSVTVWVWAMVNLRVSRTPVDAGRARRLASALMRAVKAGVPEARPRADSAEMYDLLVAPRVPRGRPAQAAHLRGRRPVAEVPFGALFRPSYGPVPGSGRDGGVQDHRGRCHGATPREPPLRKESEGAHGGCGRHPWSGPGPSAASRRA